ncbi:MAG: hypothetical protein JO056_04325 [Alphaproteobacteria bacterium]|nr:hypothetical protein [Alphaproteobacteria bacterium]
MIGLFIISIYASLLAPVAGVGGVVAGILFWARKVELLCIAVPVIAVAFGFLSSFAHPDSGLGDHIYFVASHICASVLWAIFTVALSKLVPQELPSGRRMRLQERAGLNRGKDNS